MHSKIWFMNGIESATSCSRLLVVLIALSALLNASAAAAQSISGVGPSQIVSTVGDSVRFFGSVSGLPVGEEADYDAYVEGVRGTPTITPGGFEFGAHVPVGPTVPNGGFSPTAPYTDFITEPFRITVPIVVELFHIPTQTVVSRHKMFVWDLRVAGIVDIQATSGREVLGVQITTRGVDALEPAFLSTLPQPDLAAFNGRLTVNFPEPHQEYATVTRYLSRSKTCVPLTRLPPAILDTPELLQLRFIALAQYLAFQAAQSAGLPTVGFCVRRPDFAAARHWEVCIGRLEGDLTSAALIGGVTKVDLGVGGDAITSLVDLSNIDALVDVRLRDLSIRWKDNPLCTYRDTLTATVDEARIDGDPGLAAMTTCAGTNAHANKAATTNQISLPLWAGVDSELFAVEDGGAASFDITSRARTPNGSVGICAMRFIASSVNALLRQYYDPLELALGDAWIEQSPQSEFALAMDSLLSPVEHGTYDAPLDHTIQSEFTRLGTGNLNNGDPVDGVWFQMRTDAELKPEFEVASPAATFVRPGAADIPWSEDGLTANAKARTFDMFFSTTTGALNQVLRERKGTEVMNFTISPAPGEPSLGEILADVAPIALAPLTRPTVQWRVSASVAPFTLMPADPIGSAKAPIVYHLNDLFVDAVEPGVGDLPDRRLLRLSLDFLDPDLSLDYPETLGALYLTPTLSDSTLLAAMVVESDLPGCPMRLHDPKFVDTCERRLEDLAVETLRPTVQDMMVELLSAYPAPQFFDAEGKAMQPFQLKQRGVHQLQNRITFYGNVPD